MPTINCPVGHPNDTRRFISVALIRKAAEKHTETVDARVCPKCGVVFADTDEMKRLWSVYQPK
jgi:Zn-finger nucleic acid-binding protein